MCQLLGNDLFDSNLTWGNDTGGGVNVNFWTGNGWENFAAIAGYIKKISCIKQVCGVEVGDSFPTCAANQVVVKKADNSGLECRDYISMNYLTKLQVADWSSQLEANAFCETVNSTSVAKLLDENENTGITCYTNSSSSDPYGRIKVDLGSKIKGVVFLKAKFKGQTPESPGSGQVWMILKSSLVDSAAIRDDLDQVDSVSDNILTGYRTVTLNGSFEGRYLYLYFDSYHWNDGTHHQLDINAFFEQFDVYAYKSN